MVNSHILKHKMEGAQSKLGSLVE